MSLDVLGLGFCCMDDLLLLSQIPPPEGRCTILRRERQGGGMAATALVAVARLGGAAGFIPKVGDDPVGTEILDEFRRYGVDVQHAVVEADARSHVTVVLVDARSGERSFLSQRGSVGEHQPAELDRAYVQRASILHLSDAGPAARQAAAWAREAGRQVCFDGTHFHPSVFHLLPQLDYLIVSRFFASEFVAHRAGRDLGSAAHDFARVSGAAGASDEAAQAPVSHGSAEVEPLRDHELLDAAHDLRALGPPVVVVTEGERGSWCAAPEGGFRVPAFPARAVDTTGAGDVFHGAFLFARARGWSLQRSLLIASATASLKCRALGGRAGIPTLEEVQSLVEFKGEDPS